VVNVSWNDARAYVAWLSEITGKNYRLLTESEREYVARAGTTTPFWWGASISFLWANYNSSESYGGGPRGGNRKRPMPVDSLRPNPWGLYQVFGNVSEWVEDCWNEGYRGAPTDGSAWTGGDCNRRVYRGGSWTTGPSLLRAASRVPADPGIRHNFTGLRVARTLAP
jgi:formylglycine-generating enzyme required for sulfatase activity